MEQTITNEEFWVDVRFTVKAYGSTDAIDYVHDFIPDVELDHPVQSWVIARSKEKSFSEPMYDVPGGSFGVSPTGTRKVKLRIKNNSSDTTVTSEES